MEKNVNRQTNINTDEYNAEPDNEDDDNETYFQKMNDNDIHSKVRIEPIRLTRTTSYEKYGLLEQISYFNKIFNSFIERIINVVES